MALTNDTGSSNNTDPVKQFYLKNQILEKYFLPSGFREIYSAIFKPDESDNLTITYVIEGQGMGRVSGLNELMEVACFRKGIFIRPASFFNDYVTSKTLKSLYCLIIDIDCITPEALEYFICHILSKVKLK